MFRSLITVILVSALAASAAQPHTTILLERSSPTLDGLAEARARSEAYLKRRHQQQAPARSAELMLQAATLLAEAQVAAGQPPSGWRRMASCALSSDEQRQRMAAARVKLEAARAAVREGLVQARLHLDAIEAELGISARAEPRRALLLAERSRLETRATGLEASITEVADALSCQRGSVWEQVPGFWQWGWGLGAVPELEELRTGLAAWGAGRGPGVLSADLTYVQGRLQPGSLPTESITPAYLAPEVSPLQLEDTTQDREVELSPEVVAKAQQLGSAKAAYEFVKNELRLDWYFGSMKGATETLREGRGNDADLAVLLVSLLRAQGTPARFVEGVIELPVGRLADLLGLLGEQELKALYTPAPGAEPFVLPAARRQLALSALSGAGIPFESVVVAGQVRAVRLSHLWVEAWLPIGDYRGVGALRDGSQWVPLEPSIPSGPKYVATAPALDVLTAMGSSAEQLTQEYLLEGQGSTPLEFVRARVEEYLAAHKPKLTYADMLREVEQRPELLPLLPGALPYHVVSVQGEYPFLPDTRKHRLRISARDESGTFLDVTLPMHQLVGRRSIFTYKPASEEDAELINSAGGFYAAPASVVRLLASVRVGGVEQAAATRPVGLGARHRWTLELLLPDGTSRRVDNEIIAGNLVAIGLGGPHDRHVEPLEPASGDLDGPASLFLYGRAAAYVNAWTEAEETLARLTQVVPVRPTASLVLVENQLEVKESFGIRQRVVWKGLEVDADFRSLVPLELVPGRGAALLRLSGYEGSAQEAKILTDGAGVRAVSAVTLVQEAHQRGVPVLRIDQDNMDLELGKLQAPPEVFSDVSDLVERGREVLIPASPLVIQDWSGTGFIARDPQTEEGGYFLSGRLSGGQTVVSPGGWSDQELVRRLESPDAPRSTNDLSRVARIIKVSATDLQEGTVGQPLPRMLEVYVTTIEGIPVEGAPVTFRSGDVSKPKFGEVDSASSSTAMVYTDSRGRARVQAWPDTEIKNLYILQPGKPHEELRGFNVVTAEAEASGGALALNRPFWFTAKPGPLAKLRTNVTEYLTHVGMELGIPLEVKAVDSFGNVLANQPVSWISNKPARFFLPETGRMPRVQFLGSDPAQVEQLTTVTSTLGDAAAGFIPGMEAGVYTVTAQRETVKQSFSVRATPPFGGRFTFRVATPVTAANNGVYRGYAPMPYNVEILRLEESGWVRVKGNEPDIKSARVTMRILDNRTGALLSTTTVSPFTLGTEELKDLDGEDNAVFWPKYEVRNGWQRLEFTADVEQLKDGKAQRECCDILYFARNYSGAPEVTMGRPLLGGASQPMNACGQVAPGDETLQVSVDNPADYPLYARVVERPELPGKPLLEVPPPDVLRRDPQDVSRLHVFEAAKTRFTFGLPVEAISGKVDVEVYARDFRGASDARILLDTFTFPLRREHGGAGLVEQELRASIIFAVRNFASARTSAEPGGDPSTRTKTTFRPARLRLCANESGQLKVFSGGVLVAGANIVVGEDGVVRITPISPDVPLLEDLGSGLLGTLIMPGDPGGQEVEVVFDPLAPDAETTRQVIPLRTSIEDASGLPVGHTFVKDVSTVDGHLVKQAVDLEMPGRGPGLQLTRTYTSRGHDASPLGRGWTHSYRGYVLKSFDQDTNAIRLMVVGGEGTGQVFQCAPDLRACDPQLGFHGTFRGEGPGLVLRTKNGTEYRYGAAVESAQGPLHPLLSIRDTTGQEVTLEYGDASVDSEVTRVYEPGRKRFLQFTYARPSRAARAQLERVDLYRNPEAPAPLPSGTEPEHLKVCLAYRYNARSQVTSVQRYEECPADPSKQAPLRQESFTYVESPDEVLWNNLATWTDANGHTTTYEYYQPMDALPGEHDFLRFGEKAERIRFVKEPEGAITQFSYRLVQGDVQVIGRPIKAFVTEVLGPRPEVLSPTRYHMALDGTVVHVERSLSPTVVARTSAEWDPVHMRRLVEEDARGRRTSFKYDDFGNLTERRTVLAPLPESGEGKATVAVTDADGQVFSETVEKWSYDKAFGVPVCAMDAEGRITVTMVDSSGADPRSGSVTGTGRVLSTRLYAQRAPVGRRGGLETCQELATGLATSPDDIVQHRVWCGVRGGTCTAGALTGDLVETRVEGELTRNRITAYDASGLPAVQVASVDASRQVETRFYRNARGQLERRDDTFGHVTLWKYDGLDRVERTERFNAKAAGGTLSLPSPSLVQTFSYSPGGQLEHETNGITGFARHYELDDLNRVKVVRETGGKLTEELVTTYAYDKAGNRTSVTDRRGVTTLTKYDWGDRPIETSVRVAEGVLRYTNQRGVNGSNHEVVTTTFGYDAAGNKVHETDLHGHRTEYVLDSLYRVVASRAPSVPGASFAESAVVRYVGESRYDLVGNLTRKTDGNLHTTRMEYDFANRLVRVVDAEGREERRAYDHNGNPRLIEQRTGEIVHLAQTTTYDGLNRPLTLVEKYLHPGDGGALVPRERRVQTHYTDAKNTVTVKDARGFVTTTEKDDADRVIRVVVDDDAGELSRTPDVSVGPALRLTTLRGYDGNGNLSTEVDPLGRKTTHEYDGLNRRLVMRSPMEGVKETFTHDGEGAVIVREDARGVERKFSFDMFRRPVSDTLVEKLSNSGTELALLTRKYTDMAGPDGLTSVEEKDARGNVTLRYADALHRELLVVDAKGKTRATRYDAVNPREQRDPKGYVSLMRYDTVDRLVSQKDVSKTGEVQYAQAITYDDAGQSETHTDRRSIPLKKQLDGLGRVVRTLRGAEAPFLQKEETTYDARDQVVSMTDANGHRKEWRYDGAGRKVVETLGADDALVAATTTYTYDAAGNLVERKGPRTTGVTYDERTSFDDLNRPVRHEDALGNVWLTAYDEAGNKVCEKRPLGLPALGHGQAAGMTLAQLQSAACTGEQVTRYEYDELSKLTAVTDALGGRYTFVYDAARNLVAKQDANANLTAYEYDVLNLRRAEHQHLDAHLRLGASNRGGVPGHEGGATPGGEVGTLTWTWTYDANGNVEAQTDPKGQVTTSVHGLLNRLESRTFSGDAVRELPYTQGHSFEYDGNGNLLVTRETKQTRSGQVIETTSSTYDPLDRLWTQSRPYAGVSKTVSYEYDAQGNRKKVADSDGVTTTYTYDALNRLKTATLAEGTTEYLYWPDSLRKGSIQPNGVREGRCYDKAGRLEKQVTALGAVDANCGVAAATRILSRFEYAYDRNGNRSSMREWRTDPATQLLGSEEKTEYGYDALDRLTWTRMPEDKAVLYKLDAVGNRKGEREAPWEAVAPLISSPDVYTAVPSSSLSRDVTSTFNRADWVRTSVDAKDSSRNVTFGYDLNGNLVSKLKDGSTRTFAWDVRNTLTAVFDGTTEVGRYDYDTNLQRVRRDTASEHVAYVLDEDFILQELDASQASQPAKRRYHYAKAPLAVSDISGGTHTRFLGTDALGSVTDATSASGAVATRRQYDAWGKHRGGTAPSASDFKLGFSGHQYDPETGLIYARARYYDSDLGRFISRDSYEGVLGDAPSLHRYAYARLNPLSFVDPSGHAGVRTEINRYAERAIDSGSNVHMGLAAFAGAVWDVVDFASAGTTEKLDSIHDRESSGDARYHGEYGTLQYLQDVSGTVGVGALKIVVAGKLDKVLGVVKGGTVLSRLGKNVLFGALETGGGNAAGQMGELVVGQRDEFSVTEAGVESVKGGIARGGFALLGEGAVAAAPVVQKAVKNVAQKIADRLNNLPDRQGMLHRVGGGARSRTPLSQSELDAAQTYAEELGMPRDKIVTSQPDTETSWGEVYGEERLFIANDLKPTPSTGRSLSANQRVSERGAIAHEIVGHREASIFGRSRTPRDYEVWSAMSKQEQALLNNLEEAQASLRAAKFAPGLSNYERKILFKDAMERLGKVGMSVDNVPRLNLFLESRTLGGGN